MIDITSYSIVNSNMLLVVDFRFYFLHQPLDALFLKLSSMWPICARGYVYLFCYLMSIKSLRHIPVSVAYVTWILSRPRCDPWVMANVP